MKDKHGEVVLVVMLYDHSPIGIEISKAWVQKKVGDEYKVEEAE